MHVLFNKEIDYALSRLLHLAVADPLTGFGDVESPEEMLRAYNDVVEEIKSDGCAGVAKVYADNGALVGFAIVAELIGATRAKVHEYLPTANMSVSLIFVDPPAKCRGFGKAMVKHIQELMTDLVWVAFEENVASINLARSSGFVRKFLGTNPAKNYYGVYRWVKSPS